MSRVGSALSSLTPGQRWTASLAVALAAAVALFGQPGPTAVAAAAPVAAVPDGASGTGTDLPVPSAMAGEIAAPIPPLTDDALLPSLVPAPSPPPTPPTTTDPGPAPPSPCYTPPPVPLLGVVAVDALICSLLSTVPLP